MPHTATTHLQLQANDMMTAANNGSGSAAAVDLEAQAVPVSDANTMAYNEKPVVRPLGSSSTLVDCLHCKRVWITLLVLAIFLVLGIFLGGLGAFGRFIMAAEEKKALKSPWPLGYMPRPPQL